MGTKSSCLLRGQLPADPCWEQLTPGGLEHPGLAATKHRRHLSHSDSRCHLGSRCSCLVGCGCGLELLMEMSQRRRSVPLELDSMQTHGIDQEPTTRSCRRLKVSSFLLLFAGECACLGTIQNSGPGVEDVGSFHRRPGREYFSAASFFGFGCFRPPTLFRGENSRSLTSLCW